ncbi:endolytic transglycosylase MltG [Nonomuraea sp. NPDC059194]|uniref:endolytic transglycosylase MltG n=1 Tax=Nonomuraea sp. NPDC059194 TaxID=3346764 RepID=UPI00369F370D
MNIEDLLRETLTDMAAEEQPPPPSRFLQATGRRRRRGLVLATAAAAAVAVLAAGSTLAVRNLSPQGPALDNLVAQSPLPVTVTVREGQWLWQTFRQLTGATGRPVRDFERAARDGAALGLPGYAKGGLEGFAFPGTYEVSPSSNPGELLAAMVSRFKRAADSAGLAEGAKRLRRTPLEVLTVASIVEAETRDKRDMPKVARVIYNRLNRTPEMRLQLDSPLRYGTGKAGGEVTLQDLKRASPYNTYQNAGLPPGPIGNPGADAIEAALRPATGPWLYFVETDPKKGTMKFTASETEFFELTKERRKNLKKG